MIPRKIVSMVGGIYIDVEIGPDCDGGTEIRCIESMTYMLKNKGATIFGDLMSFRDFTGKTPAQRINSNALLEYIAREATKRDAEDRRTSAEDRAIARESIARSGE